MTPRFFVPPLGRVAQCADALVFPFMFAVTPSGESPQLTHRWNNIRLDRSAADHLDRMHMVACKGDSGVPERRAVWDLRFHLGWWKRYIVLEPADHAGPWYVGWTWERGSGASRIPVEKRVRCLIGPGDVEFFGVKATDCAQIKLREAGRGELGDKGPFRRVPLR